MFFSCSFLIESGNISARKEHNQNCATDLYVAWLPLPGESAEVGEVGLLLCPAQGLHPAAAQAQQAEEELGGGGHTQGGTCPTAEEKILHNSTNLRAVNKG